MTTNKDYRQLLAYANEIKRQVREISELDGTRPDIESINLQELRHKLDDMSYFARTLMEKALQTI